ncbi:restriction endonuclease [Pediococcus pentosaceus]|uniref:restriction endonuclease n=1 Tax=Pediococcus pentosaceus TaxID=1255 RepID=UPI00315ED108
MFNIFKTTKRKNTPSIQNNIIEKNIPEEHIKYLAEELDTINKKHYDRLPKLIAFLFKYNNYHVEIIDGYTDNGIDIIASNNLEKIAIQVKQHSIITNYLKINRDDMSKFCLAVKDQGFTKNYYITTHYFTKQAKILANKHNVQPIDRQELFKFINQLCPELLPKVQYRQSITNLQTNCPECQHPAIRLKGPYGIYYECLNCNNTFNLKDN